MERPGGKSARPGAHRPVANRGARQRQRTADALMHAGERLFGTRPVEGVTIDQIVDAADVAKGSFYNHFEDKEEFAVAVYELIRGDCEFHIFAANRGVRSAPVRIVRALCVVLRYAMAHPERIQALISLSDRRESVSAPLNAGVVADVREGLEQRSLAHIDCETGVMVALGIVREAVRQTIAPWVTTPPELIAAKLGAATLRALGVKHTLAQQYAQAAAEDILLRKDQP